jgi:hypothetical protein
MADAVLRVVWIKPDSLEPNRVSATVTVKVTGAPFGDFELSVPVRDAQSLDDALARAQQVVRQFGASLAKAEIRRS